jgi:hypothetical protein
MKKMVLKITLNGGPVNVWHNMGLTCNPFPHIARAESASANRMLQMLDSDPLQSTDDIRRILHGCTEEFIEVCCHQFVPGQRIAFTIEFPERS